MLTLVETVFSFPKPPAALGLLLSAEVTLGPVSSLLCLRCFILYSRAIPTFFLPADVLEFLLWVVVVFCDLWLSVCVQQVGRKFGF